MTRGATAPLRGRPKAATTTRRSSRTPRRCSMPPGSSARCWRESRWGRTPPLTLALAAPERVAGLALVTPAFDPQRRAVTDVVGRTRRRTAQRRHRGLPGCLRLRRDAGAVARGRPAGDRTAPGGAGASRRACRCARTGAALAALRVLRAARDDRGAGGDRGQPRRGRPGTPAGPRRTLGAHAIPGAQLAVEDPGRSPFAWQGGRVSALIAELVAAAPARIRLTGVPRWCDGSAASTQGPQCGSAAGRAGRGADPRGPRSAGCGDSGAGRGARIRALAAQLAARLPEGRLIVVDADAAALEAIAALVPRRRAARGSIRTARARAPRRRRRRVRVDRRRVIPNAFSGSCAAGCATAGGSPRTTRKTR